MKLGCLYVTWNGKSSLVIALIVARGNVAKKMLNIMMKRDDGKPTDSAIVKIRWHITSLCKIRCITSKYIQQEVIQKQWGALHQQHLDFTLLQIKDINVDSLYD